MLKVEFSNKKFRKISFNEPNICPMCSHSIQPILIANKAKFYEEDRNGFFSVFFECPHCNRTFISAYEFEYKESSGSYLHFKENKFLYSAPIEFKRQEFSKYIENNYPSFVKIYNQSLQAECIGLDEIAGIGYRKSLEFLIKDFLILHENIEASKVKPTTLGNCINTMVQNPQLKTAASRATWLGNDHTHYDIKYTDKDIDDLKRLIKLSVNWIEMIYLTDEAEQLPKK